MCFPLFIFSHVSKSEVPRISLYNYRFVAFILKVNFCMIVRLLKVNHMFGLGILGEGRPLWLKKFQHTVFDVLKDFKQVLVTLKDPRSGVL